MALINASFREPVDSSLTPVMAGFQLLKLGELFCLFKEVVLHNLANSFLGDYLKRLICIQSNNWCLLIALESNSLFIFLVSLNMESEALEEEESHIIINAVKDANIPKFVAEDVPLFKSILADLFPGMDPAGPDNNLLKVNIV